MEAHNVAIPLRSFDIDIHINYVLWLNKCIDLCIQTFKYTHKNLSLAFGLFFLAYSAILEYIPIVH